MSDTARVGAAAVEADDGRTLVTIRMQRRAAVKAAYDAFALEMGSVQPFEHISAREAYAWERVVEAMRDDEIDCECGMPLYCLCCDRELVEEGLGELKKAETIT